MRDTRFEPGDLVIVSHGHAPRLCPVEDELGLVLEEILPELEGPANEGARLRFYEVSVGGRTDVVSCLALMLFQDGLHS